MYIHIYIYVYMNNLDVHILSGKMGKLVRPCHVSVLVSEFAYL